MIRNFVETLGAELRLALAAVDLLGGDLVLLPVITVIAVILEKRLKIVHGMGIFGVRCFAVLKLVEESDELIFLILR